MGGGNWDSDKWKDYSTKNVANKRSVHDVYTAKKGKTDYLPNGVKMRESCDSADHPLSTPIIFGLDITASMNNILHLVAEKLGVLVTEIINRQPVSDPQIMFHAIGDVACGDEYPLQITQFESDLRIATQLMELYFAGGGGGNGSESYPLTWWFAANHTKADNYTKRGKKGFIFTLGDDGVPTHFTASQLERVFGYKVEKTVTTAEILAQVNRQYEVFHLCLEQGSTMDAQALKGWQDLLGERAIRVTDYTKIPEIIVSILEAMAGKNINDIVNSWDGNTALVVASAIRGLKVQTGATDLVEF